ncbi:MAG: hypothetical protein ACMXYD_04470 [Candidatus Woesearchaeota archaeon]
MSGEFRKVSVFQEEILGFYKSNKRFLAWRETTSVYEVAVSEFMLQQTQVSRVQEKYVSFLQRFPSAQDLAGASQKDVLLAWQGLGYNRRALWLQGLASFLVTNPAPTYEELLSVKGVGSYTAAAICSFAYNQDIVVSDVNVSRVFTRFFGGDDKELLQEALPQGKSRDWYNALMDFGSLVCTKKRPSCSSCPLASSCYALKNDSFSEEKSSSQKRFVGSLRWHRGEILKALLKQPRTQEQLWYYLDEKYRDTALLSLALDQYVEEGFVRRDDGLFVVA